MAHKPVTEGIIEACNGLRDKLAADQSPLNVYEVFQGTSLLISTISITAIANENGWGSDLTGPLGRYIEGFGAAIQTLGNGVFWQYDFIMKWHAAWLQSILND